MLFPLRFDTVKDSVFSAIFADNSKLINRITLQSGKIVIIVMSFKAFLQLLFFYYVWK